jgi:hypothetical protein
MTGPVIATKHAYEIVAEFHDAAVSGSDDIEDPNPAYC